MEAAEVEIDEIDGIVFRSYKNCDQMCKDVDIVSLICICTYFPYLHASFI